MTQSQLELELGLRLRLMIERTVPHVGERGNEIPLTGFYLQLSETPPHGTVSEMKKPKPQPALVLPEALSSTIASKASQTAGSSSYSNS